MFNIVDLLYFARSKGASDLYLKSGFPPSIKIYGKVCALDLDIVSHDVVTKSVYQILNKPQAKQFEVAPPENIELVFGVTVKNNGRFRISINKTVDGIFVSIRVIYETPSLKEMKLDLILGKYINQSGLLLLSGNQGSGRSTTASAIIKEVNERHEKCIVTFEEPVEVLYQNKLSFISQREYQNKNIHLSNSLEFIRFSNPQIIYIDYLTDHRVMMKALQFAASGSLVIAPFSVDNPIDVIFNFIQSFPPSEQMLATSLFMKNILAVFCQKLYFNESTPIIDFSLLDVNEMNKSHLEKKELDKLELVNKYGISQPSLINFNQK